MKTTGKICAVSLRAALSFSLSLLPLTGACLQDEDAKFAEFCEAKAAVLDPEGANRCLDRLEILLKSADENPERGTALLERLNALKDISDLLDLHTEAGKLRHALAKRMWDDSPLSRLGLAPEQDKLLGWVKTHKPEKHAVTAQALRSWETLSPGERRWVELERRLTQNEWDGFSLFRKNEILHGYAEHESEKFFRIPPAINTASVDEIKNSAMPFWDDLGRETKEKLYQHIRRLRAIAAVRERSSGLLKENQAGLDALRKEFEEIKGLSPVEQLAKLNTFFENSAEFKDSALHAIITTRRQSAAVEIMADKEKETLSLLLQTALMKEMAGTVAGDKIAEFFRQSGAKLLVKVALLPMAHAQFDPHTGEIIISEGLIREWMRIHRLTPRDLLDSAEHLKRLALLLSPAFIHEATHQEQQVWLSARKLRDPGISDFEVETMSMQALYVMEKYKKDADFRALVSSETSPSDYLSQIAGLAAQFKKDPAEFRKTVRGVYYSTLISFETAASLMLESAKDAKYDLPDFDDEAGGRKKQEKPGEKPLSRYTELAKRFRENTLWLDEAREKIIARYSPGLAAKVPVP